MNFVLLAGRLGSDPETRFTPSGQKVTNFRFACSSKKGGKDETIWYRVTVWGDQYDKMLPYMKKGTALMIQGELHKPQIYTDKESKPQTSLEITASSISFSPFGKSDASSSAGSSNKTAAPSASGYESNDFDFEPVMQGSQHPAFQDDEIPF
ncbi:MAG: single-stranded DNA-binding protein [Chlamydiae bacterium]|jgi:single-strand DNA-binding protein|nr:single-stranded DNA-binding protein [Chlamydiota bacterium]